uniref:Major capsid protein n=1 Tax=Podoviridae sp. ctq8112 TaxID=2826579 RepID=A0A8S5M3R1_9CAUD|nr:MAG TPA: major capsid protein [Podoviridae sp. ctq8112]
MKVNQIYEIMNDVTHEVLGEKAITVAEDLSNIVDIGKEILNGTDIDNYVKSLVDHIGRVIFVNRKYSGGAPSVLMDGWEFGSILEKITADLPEATENESWELENGTSYDPNIFYQPKVSAKFFNNRVTFEIPMSFTERQVKSSFSSREQLNGFVSMLYNAIDRSMVIKTDSLIMRTINNFIGETLHAEYPDNDYTAKSTVKAVNLLNLYNAEKGTTLTADKCLTDTDFIKYSAYMMKLYVSRLGKASTLFNIGKKDRFTPRDMLHIVLLDNFASASDVYLQSDTFHNELTEFPNHETVPFWQGSGENYSFTDVSTIDIKTSGNNTIKATGILGVMFDRDSLGVTNLDRRVTSQYNAKAEFFNNWFKFDAGYFNDMNENFVVFFVA